MTTFVDTSALLAVLDASDHAHNRSARAWVDLVESQEVLVTSNYVLIELFAVAQARLGIAAVRDLANAIVPLLRVVSVDSEIHERGMAALMIAGRRRLSLVDCVSFEVLRDLGVQRCFTLDRDFAEQGLERIP